MRTSLALFAFTLFTSAAISAQSYSCPGGATPIVVPGYGTYCPATQSAPEIHSSSMVGGGGLLLCTAIMLYPRKKRVS